MRGKATMAMTTNAPIPEPPARIARIVRVVADFYNLTPDEIVGRRRHQHISHARQVCMYLLRRHTKMTATRIAYWLGGRDHTTVLHGVNAIEAQLVFQEDLRRELGIVENLLKEAAA